MQIRLQHNLPHVLFLLYHLSSQAKIKHGCSVTNSSLFFFLCRASCNSQAAMQSSKQEMWNSHCSVYDSNHRTHFFHVIENRKALSLKVKKIDRILKEYFYNILIYIYIFIYINIYTWSNFFSMAVWYPVCFGKLLLLYLQRVLFKKRSLNSQLLVNRK